MNQSLFSKTPSVTVLDNRGLSIRNIEYHRHPDTPTTTDERITRQRYNPGGFLTRSADPRLDKAGLANFTYITDLAGNVLRAQGVDNGTTVTLNDVAGRPVVGGDNIDAAGDKSQAVIRRWQYEAATLPGRPLSVTESTAGGAARVTERFVYAGNSAAEKARNLAGACISHYDPAGLEQTDAIALTGAPLSVTRRLLKDADNPAVVADWQGQDASAWNDLLAAETLTTQNTADSTGTPLTITDAKGNVQRVTYDVAGLLSGSWLTLKGGKEQAIVKALTWSAAGQKLREEHGNGVVTTYAYEPETQRLTGIKTERPAGHVSGAKVLQDIRYEYDPVGNVLTIRNDAEETRFWRNQKVVPENTYSYDSLYQLVSATGREMASAGQQSSQLPSATVPLPTDSAAFTSYTRTYAYDNGGNLTQIRHNAAATNHRYTTDITISDRSNRGVLSTLAKNPSDVDGLFTPGGQQKQLQPGQNLTWTLRNELLKVSPVARDGGVNDSESYRYDGGSQRILKVSTQQTGNSTQTQRALYLPGLELRTTKTGSSETESLQVITVGEAGRAQVRVLHWAAGKPADIGNDGLRYSYDNLTGGSQLELDGSGNVISQEEYYPYGGTAVWAARSQTEANYKTARYSGKERDATGLYYYGYRYYQPWAGRWLSADPAGTVDGLNLFRMCRNNPVNSTDDSGLFTRRFIQWFREKRTERRVNKSYQQMSKGTHWKGEITSFKSVSALSDRNIENLRGKNYPLTKESYDFVESFKKLNFNLIHYSDVDLINDGKAVFRSRRNLLDRRMIFEQGNTTDTDINFVGTDDFSFFSLKVGNAEGKQVSRFGHQRYDVNAASVENYKYFKRSHVAINDTLKFDFRQTNERRLYRYFDSKDVNFLRNENMAAKASETIFTNADFREGMALRIIDSVKNLTPDGQSYVFSSNTDNHIDTVLSLFLRPQLLVPKKLEATDVKKSYRHQSYC
ncbi:hypothetical protein LH23_01570 [Cedecea neteri]|uniref:Uncharacterized protein n=1 Tax=Cedecea neteri TaxID=158822 RepID=A0AAN0S151_9ENTR|nr:hypothetical protein LH23_01570 [Cedecea neteri]